MPSIGERGVPIHSLYSETREPTDAMLRDVDVIVVDLQGVGCRIYTFAYTMANCMRAAKQLGKKVIVCDRPNPIGGEQVAGNVTRGGHESFVGQFSLPTRHGMTMGELARLFNEHFGIGCELEVVELGGWSRDALVRRYGWAMGSCRRRTFPRRTVAKSFRERSTWKALRCLKGGEPRGPLN